VLIWIYYSDYWHNKDGTGGCAHACPSIFRCTKCTLCSEKTPTYVFDYNSGVGQFFLLFALLEREINMLQFTYLLSRWRHNCVTLHATKVFFTELLLLNIKYIEFWIEFEDEILIKNLWKCKRFYARRLTKNSVQKKLKRWTLDGFLRKLQTTGSIERTPWSGRPRSSQNVMFLR